MSYPKLQTQGPLETLFVPGDPSAPTLIFFHGYGANAWDLASLAGELDLPFRANFYFPNAPIPLPNPMGMPSQAWFHLDPEALQRAFSGQASLSFKARDGGALGKCVDKYVGPFLESLGVPPEKMALIGFSQGSTVALEAGLRQSALSPSPLVLWSSTDVDKLDWEGRMSSFKGRRVFQSHGRKDPVLSIEAAEILAGRLERQGWDHHWFPFNGAHEIPPQIIEKVSTFLSESFP